VDQWCEAELAFPSGATGMARCRMAGDGVEMSLRVTGTDGEVVAPNFVAPQRDDRLIVRGNGGDRVERLGTRPSFASQLEAFTAAVRDAAELPTDAADAVRNLGLIDDCYRAIGLGPRPRSKLT